MNELHLIDCMKFMKEKPDNFYELAIVDPPYGLDINSSGTHFKSKYEVKEWDKNTPSNEYFSELVRISKYQIVWGGNYFLDRLGNCKCYIIWDKKIAAGMSFAMCEMAWTSFKTGAKIYKSTANQNNRIHPTQKPVKLYKWLLKNYAKPNDKIIDTHSGSGSLRIACHDLGFDLDSCEIDKDYFNDNEARFKRHTSQQDLFSGDDYQNMIFKERI